MKTRGFAGMRRMVTAADGRRRAVKREDLRNPSAVHAVGGPAPDPVVVLGQLDPARTLADLEGERTPSLIEAPVNPVREQVEEIVEQHPERVATLDDWLAERPEHG